MSTQQRYAMPVDLSEWIIPSRFDSLMRWEYEDGRASLLNLYEKGKERQWNGNTRIDWSLDLDPENPQELPDEQISIFGSDIWNRMTARERADLRATCRPSSSRSSCTASRARCCARPRLSSRSRTSTPSSTRPRR